MTSAHEGGIQVLLMDGAVRFISEDIDSATEEELNMMADGNDPLRSTIYGTWQSLCDINDGNVIGEF